MNQETKEPRRSARAETLQRAAAAKKASATAIPQQPAKKVVKRRKTAKSSARLIATGKQEYEVSKIVDSKLERKKRHYLVQWKGYAAKYNTWEPEANLTNSQQKIQEFDVKYPNKP